MSHKTEYDKALLKCIEELFDMICTVAVALGSLGYLSEQEGKSFNRAAGKYNAAHIDLMHEMESDSDD